MLLIGKQRSYQILWGLIPISIVLVVFLIVPLVRCFIFSFQPSPVTAKYNSLVGNYIHFFKSGYYVQILYRTLRITFISMAVSFIIGYPTAYLIKKLSSRPQSFLLLMLMFPILTGPIVVVMGWMQLISTGGAVHSLVSLFATTAVRLINTETGIVIGTTHFVMPFTVIIIHNSLMSINPSLVESASILGANRWKIFWRIIWPLSLPGVLSAMLVCFSLAMSSYVTPQYLGGGTKLVLTTLVTEFMMATFNWQMASATGAVLLVLSFIVVYLMNKVFNRLIKT